MPRDLRALPRAEVHEEFALQLVDLIAQALDFVHSAAGLGDAAQIVDVFFEAVEFRFGGFACPSASRSGRRTGVRIPHEFDGIGAA